jgi:hypothetical protein
MIFTPPYYIFAGVVPKLVVDAADKAAGELKMFPARVGPSEGQELPLARSSLVGFFSPDHWINGILYHYAAIANARSWRFSLIAPSPAQYATYKESSHFEWHVDYAPATNAQAIERKITVILELSNSSEYSGGRLELLSDWAAADRPSTNPMENATSGSIVVFPSLTPHRVTPVLRGERRTITSWIVGPPLL